MSHLSRLAIAIALLCLGLTLTQRAWAQCGTNCTDASGVVSLPPGFDLSFPFKAGENVKLLSGYGPTAGSSLHCRSKDTGCANDFFALDLVLPDHPNSGKGQPVLAAAGGTVIAAGWGSSGWAAYGQRVYIQHDPGDGHKYTTLYAHLDSLNVSQGQKVNKGDVIGTLGQSCNGAKSCSNFSTPHVHFSVHRDSNFGGTGSGGSYAGRATRPEPLDGATGLQQGQTHTSKNGQSTPPPPQTCDLVIPPSETLVEDDTPCLSPSGTLSETSLGLGGHAYHATQDTPDPDYAKGAFWMLDFAQAGNYDVWAWVPGGLGNLTPEASYKIQFAGTSQKVTIDQANAAGGWAHLGSFAFAAGGNQWVRLGDNYLSASSQGKTFAIDALKIAPGAACECSQDGEVQTESCGTGSQQRSCDGCNWSTWSPCSDTDAGANNDAGSGWSDAGPLGQPPESTPPPSSLGDDEAANPGCTCSIPGGRGPTAPHSAWTAVALLALGLRRRRRARRTRARAAIPLPPSPTL
ncbi:MAG: peptidoglycan DD-metalloendopeptidase family protein [Polyangiaceae bacterium]